MTEETLEEKLAAVRENPAYEWCLRTTAEQEVKRQRERIAELERQLNEARSRIQTLLDDNANEHTEWLHYRAQVRDLERQLAAEREARLRAEAACAALRAMLDEVADAAGLRDGCCEFCGIGPSQAGEAHDEGCVALRLLDLLASPDPGAELLKAGRRVWQALSKAQWGAWSWDELEMCPVCHALMEEDGAHKPNCPVGTALALGERWFGKGDSNA